MSLTLTTPHSPFAPTRETRSRKPKLMCKHFCWSKNLRANMSTKANYCSKTPPCMSKAVETFAPVKIMGKYVIQTYVTKEAYRYDFARKTRTRVC